MSNFNYSRFGITFRWIERYSRNTMIRVLFLALAVYLFILLMNTVTASYKGIPADMQQLTLIRAIRSCGMAYFSGLSSAEHGFARTSRQSSSA